MAVGLFGTIVTSSNAVDWVACNSGVTVDLSAVTFAQGKFIVGGRLGTMLSSTNGRDWTGVAVPFYDIDALAYGVGTNYPDGLFAAMVSSNSLGGFTYYNTKQFYSSNGVDWFVASYTGTPVRSVFRNIASGQNRFLATATRTAGSSPFPFYELALNSASGRVWNSSFTQVSGACAFGNGLFMVAGGFDRDTNGVRFVTSITSTNASSWPMSLGASSVQGACFGNGRFVVVGENALVGVSTNATNWSVVSIPPSFHQLFAVTYGDGLYVTVGTSGFIATSPDGSSWTIRTKGVVDGLNDVSPAGDGFIAVGNNGAMTASPDGVSWNVVPSVTTGFLAAVIRANERYVASGDGGTIISGTSPGNMASQISGVTAPLFGLAFGAGTFVAVGNNGTILSSTDTIVWTSRNSGTTNHLFAVEFGSDRFVAVGDFGTVLTSTDAINWTVQVSGTGLSLRGVAHGRGRFVARAFAIGSPATFSSVDGVVWEAATESFAFPFLHSSGKIAFGGGWFVGSFLGGGAVLPASRDGRTWSLVTLGTNIIQPSVLTYNNGTFVNVYARGIISQTDPMVDVDINHSGLAQLTVEGPKNSVFQIESLDSLSATNAWQPLTVLSNAPYVWTDPQSATATNRIYRAVLLP